MKSSLFLVLVTMATLLSAQRPKPDLIKTPEGQLSIQPVFHGALVLTWNDKTIYVDPYGGAKAYSGLKSPDLVLITDIHPDHLDTATLAALKMENTAFIVPQAVADLMPVKFKKNVVVLGHGKTEKWKDMEVGALPMYNLPETTDSRHPKGRGNGYVISAGGKRIYISGDTEDIPEMRALRNIDVAFVCMNLPYTMDVQQAASAVSEFRPGIVYPYHYRGKDGFSDIEEFRSLVQRSGAATEVRLRDWYTVKP
jgi:L-ascorbate metabolism protein UlaG (beta-lactamase superfamily)